MSNEEKKIDSDSESTSYEEVLQKIIEKAFESGGLIVCGTPQHGKTNGMMHILRKILEGKLHLEKKLKTVTFDTALNWRFHFDSLPYVDAETCNILPTVQDLIVDVGFADSIDIRSYIGNIVLNDYYVKRNIKTKFEGQNQYLNLYIIEEAQNVLGSYSLSGNEGRFWLKILSEGANYGQIFFFLGQRLSDISAKIVERRRYFLIGATSGDNDLKKLKRMLGNDMLINAVKSLKKGEFIFYDKDSKNMTLIGFPRFTQNGKPFSYEKKESKGYARILT